MAPELEELVLRAAVAASTKDMGLDATTSVPALEQAERAIAAALWHALEWWQFALPEGTSARRVAGHLRGGLGGSSLRVLRAGIWIPPASPVEARDGPVWVGGIVQSAARFRDAVVLSVRVLDEVDDSSWVPTASEPAMPVARFAEVFEEAIASPTLAPEVLRSAGHRKLLVTNLIKTVHRAGWVLADFPAEHPEAQESTA